MGFVKLALSTALSGFATSAVAATISVSTFGVDAYNAAVDASGSVVTEDFEGHSQGNMADGFSTAVGTFATLGGTGSGGTVTTSDFANTGEQLTVRGGDVFGRTSTSTMLHDDTSMDQFLDSNDTFGIAWAVDLGGQMFDRLVLTLSDAADAGAAMRISMGGTEQMLMPTTNGNQQIVVINFDSAVDSAMINFENRSGSGRLTNDGFSLDDITVRTVFSAISPQTTNFVPAAVPVPAGAVLLLTALGGLGLARRRRR